MKQVRMVAVICVAACILFGFLFTCKPITSPIDQDDTQKSNADLSDLGISSGTLSPAFAEGTIVYNATVGSGVDSITVTATKAAAGAEIELRVSGGSWVEIPSDSPSSLLDMNVGANTIEIRVTAEDGKPVKIYTINVYRLSASALLSALCTSEGTLTPVFDANTVNYAVSVAPTANTLAVTATAEHAGATIQVRVNGGGWQAVVSGSPSPALALNVGDNPVAIKVTAEDGLSTNTYTISAHRRSVDADLSALVPSAGSLTPAFSSSTTSYTLTVGSAVSSLTLTATSAYPLATIEVQLNGGGWQACSSGSPSPALSLNVGDNTVVVRVTAEEGSPQKSYSIAVHRQSGNANLSALTISSGTLTPAFSSSITSYTNTVLYAVSSVTVTPTAASGLSTIQVQVNGWGWHEILSGSPSPALNLIPGDNKVEVKVMAEDPSFTKIYTIVVMRLYPGALDTDFATGSGVSSTVMSPLVNSIAVQSDGKILIGGYFTAYDDTSCGHVARLNSDGSLDTSFLSTGAGANDYVYCVALQSDGEILIGGAFTTYSGTSRGRVARLNSDGSLDTFFLASGAGANSQVRSIVLQSDGKILIGGLFTTYNGISRGRVARLNSDGSLDTSFATANGPDDHVSSVALQDDGKILIVGGFSNYNGTSRGGIARLNSDGSLDTSFLTSGDGANSNVYSLAFQSDDKIIVVGGFTTYNSISRKHVARLNSDGSLDTSFSTTGAGFDQEAWQLALQSDGKILVSGQFITYDGTSRGHIARLNSDGSLDNTFLAVGDGAAGQAAGVCSVAILSDGKILIGGRFTTYNGINRGGIARLWGQ